jgi:hypothetical protein
MLAGEIGLRVRHALDGGKIADEGEAQVVIRSDFFPLRGRRIARPASSPPSSCG